MRVNRGTGEELTTERLSLSEEVVATQITEGGITHEAFVGDPEGPPDGSTNVAAPGPVVKVAENDDFADEVTSF